MTPDYSRALGRLALVLLYVAWLALAVLTERAADAEPRTAAHPTRLTTEAERARQAWDRAGAALHGLARDGPRWTGWPPEDSAAFEAVGWSVDTLDWR